MAKDLIVSTTPRETRVALLEDGAVSEVFIERESRRGNVGNIHKGRVTRVLPGMQSAFRGHRPGAPTPSSTWTTCSRSWTRTS
jgi:Ribonuclease G/E